MSLGDGGPLRGWGCGRYYYWRLVDGRDGCGLDHRRRDPSASARPFNCVTFPIDGVDLKGAKVVAESVCGVASVAIQQHRDRAGRNVVEIGRRRMGCGCSRQWNGLSLGHKADSHGLIVGVCADTGASILVTCRCDRPWVDGETI